MSLLMSPRRCNDYKHICTEHKNCKIYEANIDKTKRINRQLESNSRRLKYLTLNNRTTTEKINKVIENLNNVTDQLDLTDI